MGLVLHRLHAAAAGYTFPHGAFNENSNKALLTLSILTVFLSRLMRKINWSYWFSQRITFTTLPHLFIVLLQTFKLHMMLSYLNEFLVSVIIKCPKFALHLWGLLSGLADLGWLGQLVQTVRWAPGLRVIICCLLPSPPSPWLEADCSANFPGPTKHICLHAVASVISDHLLNISTVLAAVWSRLWT